jgi:plastocyanin
LRELTNRIISRLGVSVAIVLTILLIPPSYALSVHAQLVYMDEIVEVKISNCSSAVNNSQFYAPPEVHVAAGSSIKWTNDDNVIHTVTQGKPSEGANSTGFNSGPIQPRSTFVHFFDESGTVDYYCTIHPHMIGKVIVNLY